MKKKIPRVLGFLLILLILAGSAYADPLYEFTGILNGIKTDGLHVAVSAQAIARQPYSTERLAPLNKLLSYLVIDAEIADDCSTVRLQADDNTALTWIRSEAGGQIRDWIDAVPENVYLGSNGNDLLTVLDIGTEEDMTVTGLSGKEYLFIDEYRNFIPRIPELFPDQCRTEKVRTKIRDYGTATEKVTCTVPKAMIDDESYSSALISVCSDGSVKEWLKSISFAGKQTVILYKDENGQVIKFVYAGKIKYADDKTHSLNLNWKLTDGNGITRDQIVLKSPAVNGNDRDNLNIDRNITVTDVNARTEITWSCTTVQDKEKKVMEGNADLEGSSAGIQTYSGMIQFSLKVNNDVKKGLILKPDLAISGNVITGSLEISQTVGEGIPESYLLTMKLEPTDHRSEIPDHRVEIMIPESEEELSELNDLLTEKTAERMIIPLLNLPEDALAYFYHGLTNEQWDRVTDAAEQ